MIILLTNDDGIAAKGLQELKSVLSDVHEVYTIAPDVEKSACSNAITTHSQLIVKKLADRTYSVSGFPADCINIGLNSGIVPEADLVISGINHGPNFGNDVIFSGTVAGARTAHVFGKTGIALSLDSYHKPSEYFGDASRFLLEFMSMNKNALLENRLLLSINYPDLPKENIQGVMFTHLGVRIYRDHYNNEFIADDEFAMTLDGSFEYIHDEGSDIVAVKNGFISITPLSINCTDTSLLRDMKNGKHNVIL